MVNLKLFTSHLIVLVNPKIIEFDTLLISKLHVNDHMQPVLNYFKISLTLIEQCKALLVANGSPRIQCIISNPWTSDINSIKHIANFQLMYKAKPSNNCRVHPCTNNNCRVHIRFITQ